MLFTENPWPPVIVCAIVAAILIASWLQNARKHYLIGVAGCALVSVAIVVFERLYVTDGERIAAQIVELVDAFSQNDEERMLSHFSESATVWRRNASWAMATVDVLSELHITDLDVEFFAARSRAHSHFRANGTVSVFGVESHQPTRWNLTWQDEDGTWKIIDVQRLHPISGEPIGLMSSQ